MNQAATAEQAASDNATRAAAVFDKLRALLGANADIRTVNYSLNPNYTYPRDGGTPTLAGFTATNSIEATVTDLTMIGRVIDTAIAAGATRIDGIRLMLKDEEPSRNQALRQAGLKAKARAEAIAAGLGAKLGALLSAQESASVVPVPIIAGGAAQTVTTPIQPGTLEIRGDVTVQYELLQ